MMKAKITASSDSCRLEMHGVRPALPAAAPRPALGLEELDDIHRNPALGIVWRAELVEPGGDIERAAVGVHREPVAAANVAEDIGAREQIEMRGVDLGLVSAV